MDRRPIHSGLLGLVLFLSLVPAGCQQRVNQSAAASPGPAPAEGPFDTAFGDPCSERIQSLGGALLEYSLMNKRLPARLEEIQNQSLAARDQTQLVCPESGKPYVYVPAGLASKNSPARVVLYDAVPSHQGKRGVLMMGKDPRGNPLVWTRRLTESEFGAFTVTVRSDGGKGSDAGLGQPK